MIALVEEKVGMMEKKEGKKREGIEPIKRRSSNQLKLSLSFNYREMTTQ
jgi:hypothetical protein